MAGLLPGLGHLGGRVFGWFLRRDADLAGVVAVQAAVADVHLAGNIGELFEQVVDAVGLQGAWACWRPGRNVASHRVRPGPSQILVNLMVFIFFLPDMNARRPGRRAGGRRTWISLPSIRSVTPCAAA